MLYYFLTFTVDMPPDIVIVHDGCRMFVEDKDLNSIATEAFKNGVRYACVYMSQCYESKPES